MDFRPNWSRIVADRMPPRGQTSVLIDAENYNVINQILSKLGHGFMILLWQYTKKQRLTQKALSESTKNVLNVDTAKITN